MAGCDAREGEFDILSIDAAMADLPPFLGADVGGDGGRFPDDGAGALASPDLAALTASPPASEFGDGGGDDAASEGSAALAIEEDAWLDAGGYEAVVSRVSPAASYVEVGGRKGGSPVVPAGRGPLLAAHLSWAAAVPLSPNAAASALLEPVAALFAAAVRDDPRGARPLAWRLVRLLECTTTRRAGLAPWVLAAFHELDGVRPPRVPRARAHDSIPATPRAGDPDARGRARRRRGHGGRGRPRGAAAGRAAPPAGPRPPRRARRAEKEKKRRPRHARTTQARRRRSSSPPSWTRCGGRRVSTAST